MELLYYLGLGLATIMGAALYYLIRGQAAQEERRIEAERRAYQAEVLKELGDRVGYSLEVNKVIEIITGNLGRLLDYQTVAYMTKNEGKIVFKINLKEPVNRLFVEVVKEKVLLAFSTMTNQDLSLEPLDVSVTGALFDEQQKESVRSFFNLPLVINGRVAGLINVASSRAGLYTEAETRVLYSITAQASLAMSRLSEVLETEKGKMNSLVASLSDGLVMVDANWNLLVVNPRARQMLKLPGGELTTLDVLGSVAGKLDLRTQMEKAMSEQQVITLPELAVATGTVQVTALPVKDNENKLIGIVVVFHDITEEKSLQALRDQFEAMMVHELRSPLTNMRATVDNVLRDFDHQQPQDLKPPLEIIKKEVTDMLELVNDLLDVAKLEAGKFTLTKEPQDLTVLIKDVTDHHQARADQKQLGLKVELVGDLTNVLADGFRLRQVINNLLTNALKFTQMGSVTIGANRTAERVTVWVADTGVGIAPEDKGKLFSKFYQLQSTAGHHSEGGTGLGLVIAKGIVEAHGGKIGVESPIYPEVTDREGGPGSKFWFTIPSK